MSAITLKQAAIDQLMRDPEIQSWLQNRQIGKVPFLGFYRRSYSTSRDGTITEHGNGFSLTTIDPEDADQTRGIVIRPVAVTKNFDILVGAEEATMSRTFSIGWSNRFTYEPLTST